MGKMRERLKKAGAMLMTVLALSGLGATQTAAKNIEKEEDTPKAPKTTMVDRNGQEDILNDLDSILKNEQLSYNDKANQIAKVVVELNTNGDGKLTRGEYMAVLADVFDVSGEGRKEVVNDGKKGFEDSNDIDAIYLKDMEIMQGDGKGKVMPDDILLAKHLQIITERISGEKNELNLKNGEAVVTENEGVEEISKIISSGRVKTYIVNGKETQFMDGPIMLNEMTSAVKEYRTSKELLDIYNAYNFNISYIESFGDSEKELTDENKKELLNHRIASGIFDNIGIEYDKPITRKQLMNIKNHVERYAGKRESIAKGQESEFATKYDILEAFGDLIGLFDRELNPDGSISEVPLSNKLLFAKKLGINVYNINDIVTGAETYERLFITLKETTNDFKLDKNGIAIFGKIGTSLNDQVELNMLNVVMKEMENNEIDEVTGMTAEQEAEVNKKWDKINAYKPEKEPEIDADILANGTAEGLDYSDME